MELLDLLCQGERSVEVLAKESGLAVANASQHLQVLRAARLVETEKVGLFVVYRLADQAVCEFYRTMRVLAESRLAEVEQIKRRFQDEIGNYLWSMTKNDRKRVNSAMPEGHQH